MPHRSRGTSAARHRMVARAADRRAAIGVMSLALMILLAASSLAIFTTLTAAIAATRESRDLVHAQRNIDTAESEAVYALNATPAVSSSDGTGPGHLASHQSRWSWTKSYHVCSSPTTPCPAGAGVIQGGGTLSMHSIVGDTTRDRERAWRYRMVGSRTGATDAPIYGIAAPSAWTSTISSVDNSWIEGTVAGDWHQYGNGRVTIPAGTTVPRILSFDDRSTVTGTPGQFTRSSLSARLDENLLAQRVNNCDGATLTRFRSSADGNTITAGQLSCYYSITIDEPTTIVGSGVAALVSYGDIDISADLTTSSTNQLHLYSAAGTVKFRGGATISAYLYAPNALCKTYDALTVSYTGSLVCRQVEMHGTFTQPATLPLAERPSPDLNPDGGFDNSTANDGIADHGVSFMELPGYRDRFGD